MFTWRDDLVISIISNLIINASQSTLLVKLMSVGERRANSNMGQLQQKEYLNLVKRLDLIIHTLAVQLDESPFHLAL